MRLLKIEFDRFLAGSARVPPEEARARIAHRIRELKRQKIRSFAERFRLNTLEASFSTLNDLHARRLRELEQGKIVRGRAAPTAGNEDTRTDFTVTSASDTDAIQALYRKLYGSDGRQKKADFGTFEQHVGRQIERLQKKTGCRKVQLRVASEAGKLKLKAKPIHAET